MLMLATRHENLKPDSKYFRKSFEEYMENKDTNVIYQQFITSNSELSHRAFIFSSDIELEEYKEGLHIYANPILYIKDIQDTRNMQVLFCDSSLCNDFLENNLSGIQIKRNLHGDTQYLSVLLKNSEEMKLKVKHINSIPFSYSDLSVLTYCDTFERTFEACATKDISPIKETLDNFLECELPIPVFPCEINK